MKLDLYWATTYKPVHLACVNSVFCFLSKDNIFMYLMGMTNHVSLDPTLQVFIPWYMDYKGNLMLKWTLACASVVVDYHPVEWVISLYVWIHWFGNDFFATGACDNGNKSGMHYWGLSWYMLLLHPTGFMLCMRAWWLGALFLGVI